MATITEQITLDTIFCCQCDMMFAMPSKIVSKRRESHETFYCPNGHGNHFPAETAFEHNLKLLARERQQHDQTRAEAAERTRELEKLKAATAKGKCPCCNRYFGNLHRHLSVKHPEFGKGKVKP